MSMSAWKSSTRQHCRRRSANFIKAWLQNPGSIPVSSLKGGNEIVDINRFTQKLQEALGAAQTVAVRYGNQQVDVEHLLSALLAQEGGLAVSILNKANVDVHALQQRLDADLQKLPKVSSGTGAAENVYITGSLNKLLTHADDESKKLGDTY